MASGWRPIGFATAAVANTTSPLPMMPDGQAFAALFDGTPLRILLSGDFKTLAWRKLLINAVGNPVTALTLQRKAVFRRDDVAALCLAMLEEAATVGRADGARLAADEAAQIDGEAPQPSRPMPAPRCISIALRAARLRSMR